MAVTVMLIDIAVRRYVMMTFTGPQWSVYALSVLVEGLWLYWWLGVLKPFHRSKTLAVILASLYGVTLIASWAFYRYFSTLPGKFAFRYLFGEPYDFVNLAIGSATLPLIGGVFVLVLLLSLVFHQGVKQNAVTVKPWMIWVLLGCSLVLSKNLKFNADSFLPVTSSAHAFIHASYDHISGAGQWFRLEKRLATIPVPSSNVASKRNGILIINESLRSDAMVVGDILPRPIFEFKEAYANATVTITSVPLILSGGSALAGASELHKRPLIYEWLAHHIPGLSVGIISSHSYEVGNAKVFLHSPVLKIFKYRETLGAPAFNNVGADDRYVVEELRLFLQSRKQDEPFFLVLHFNGTHYPYTVPPAFDLGGKTEKESYMQAVNYLAANLKQVWQLLDESKLLDDTFIVSTSDHGESLGEDGTIGHFGPPSPVNSKVGMWAYIPPTWLDDISKQALTENESKVVFNQDLFPTITQLLQVPSGKVPGTSLMIKGKPRTGFIYNFVEAPKDERSVGVVTDTGFVRYTIARGGCGGSAPILIDALVNVEAEPEFLNCLEK